MPNTATMDALERLHEKPIKEVILELYLRHRSVGLVANELSISRFTLNVWCSRIGLTASDLKLAALKADNPEFAS